MQLEGRAQVAANVLANLDVLDLAARDTVQQAARLLGALRRVLRQVAGTAPTLLVIGAELLHVKLRAPPDGGAATQLVGNLHADLLSRGPEGVLEELRREPAGRRPDLFGAVRGHPPVQADHRMQMHEAAVLVLSDLHVRHPHLLVQPLLRHPDQGGEAPRQIDHRPSPQLTEQVVPDHRPGVVETVGAQRLAEARIVRGVNPRAGNGDAVAADRPVAPRPAPRRLSICAKDVRVHDAERRSGQRREHRRMPHHGLRDALAAP